MLEIHQKASTESNAFSVAMPLYPLCGRRATTAGAVENSAFVVDMHYVNWQRSTTDIIGHDCGSFSATAPTS